MPISDGWPDVEASLEQLDEPTAKRITSLHTHLLPYSAHIANYGSSLHPHHLPCTLITHSYTWGQSFLVLELVFTDPEASESESWVARFGLPPYEGDEFFNTPEQLERKILNEVGALRIVKERTTVPVPTIHGYCARHGDGFNQTFGGVTSPDAGLRKPHPLGEAFPAFILMSALRGKTIEDCGIPIHELGGHWDVPPAEDDAPYFTSHILQNYLRSLAEIHTQLSQVTFDQIGSFTVDDETGEVRIGPMAEFGLGPFDTAEAYYGTLAEAYKRLAENAQEDEDSDDDEEDASSVVLTVEHSKGQSTDVPLSSAQVRSLKRMFTAAIFPLALGPYVPSSNDKGPFPLRHGDLHSENILVDEETGTIVGIIDWEGAGTVPWEVAGGLNWEVQGSAEPLFDEPGKERETLKRPEIHSAFSRALRKVEADMSRWFKPAKPKSLSLKLKRTPSPPETSISPSASAISLSSSSSSSCFSSEMDSMKSHSRSSSTSKFTAFSSNPTSPASSMFELNKEKGDGDVVWTGPRRMPSIAILNTPPSPEKKEPKTDLMSLAKRFFRAASEPASTVPATPPPTHDDAAVKADDDGKHDDAKPGEATPRPHQPPSVSGVEALREPLPADYRTQMVQREMSLDMAALSITDASSSSPSSSSSFALHHSRSPSATATGNARVPVTPTSSVFRTASMTRTPRTTLHKRRQSSILLPPLGLATPVGSPAHSPVIPSLHLYAPQPFAPPPGLAASLSLPPPGRKQGSPSPSGTPGERSRSSSPLATPLASAGGVANQGHPPMMVHAPSSFSYGFPRTPVVRRARSSWHEHEFGVIGSGLGVHARASSAHSPGHHWQPQSSGKQEQGRQSPKILAASLSRSANASLQNGSPSTPKMVPPAQMAEHPPAPTEREAAPASPVNDAKPLHPPAEAPVKSPAGHTLSDIHASVGAYVASYLGHFMFMLGCEYETVGKALWDVVVASHRSSEVGKQEGKEGEEKKEDVDEAFWTWVKETLRSGLEEDAEEEEEEHPKEEGPGEANAAPSSKHLELAEPVYTVERLATTPEETLRELTVELVSDKVINSVD